MAILNDISTTVNPDGSCEVKLSLIYLDGEHRPVMSAILGQNVDVIEAGPTPYNDEFIRTFTDSSGWKRLITPPRQSIYEAEPKQIQMEKFE